MKKTWRFRGGSIIVEKLWRNYGKSMKYLWNFYEALMNILCASDGKAMEI